VSQDAPIAEPLRRVSPGGTVRFAVGGLDAPRSSTHRIWTARHTPDVYLATRAVAGVQKVSLHASGRWQHSFVSDEKARPFLPAGASRHVDRWTRPPEFGPGWTRMYVVMVPGTELRRYKHREPGDVVFVPPPRPYHAVYFEVVSVAPGATTRLVVNNMILVASMALADGSEVKVFAHEVRLQSDFWRKLADYREEVVEAIRQNPRALAVENPMALLHGSQEDGTRFTLDLAIRPPTPGQAPICVTPPRVVREQGRTTGTPGIVRLR
jgi:hypothetical protein